MRDINNSVNVGSISNLEDMRNIRNKESIQVWETKKKIKEAFLDLYKKKRIEKISIKEIAERARINRGTFYVYYIDIYDLQEKIEDEAIEGIKINVIPVIKALLMNKKLDSNVLPKEFLEKEEAMLEIFFGESAESRAIEKLKKIMQALAIEMLGLQNETDRHKRVKLKYALEYISSAQIGIIGYWFRHNKELPLEDLGGIIETINLTGAITYLSSEANWD